MPISSCLRPVATRELPWRPVGMVCREGEQSGLAARFMTDMGAPDPVYQYPAAGEEGWVISSRPWPKSHVAPPLSGPPTPLWHLTPILGRGRMGPCSSEAWRNRQPQPNPGSLPHRLRSLHVVMRTVPARGVLRAGRLRVTPSRFESWRLHHQPIHKAPPRSTAGHGAPVGLEAGRGLAPRDSGDLRVGDECSASRPCGMPHA